jgi:hypothetical protein
VKTCAYLFATTCAGLITAVSLIDVAAAEAKKPKTPESFPNSGKVTKLTNGDLMCYADIENRGKKYHLGAEFDICSQTKLLNRKVKLTYKRIKIDDCQSSEPCGKTRIENLIVKMKLTSVL